MPLEARTLQVFLQSKIAGKKGDVSLEFCEALVDYIKLNAVVTSTITGTATVTTAPGVAPIIGTAIGRIS